MVGHLIGRAQTDCYLSCLCSGLPSKANRGIGSQAVGEKERATPIGHALPSDVWETRGSSELWNIESKTQCDVAEERLQRDTQWELMNYKKIAYTTGKVWMETRLAKGASNMTLEEAKQTPSKWEDRIDVITFDSQILEIEAAKLTK